MSEVEQLRAEVERLRADLETRNAAYDELDRAYLIRLNADCERTWEAHMAYLDRHAPSKEEADAIVEAFLKDTRPRKLNRWGL